MNNQYRVTLVSFLAYFVMSGALSPIGIVVGPMAEHFGRPVTEIAALFSWLTMGILVGSIAALFVFSWLRIRTLMLILYVLVTLSFGSLMVLDSLQLIGLALGLIGVCCGIGLAGAASTISAMYESERRASMLVITDGAFSVAGIAVSWVAVYLLAREFHWATAYQLVTFVAVVIVLLSLVSRFPESHSDVEPIIADDKSAGVAQRYWPIPVFLCIAALFLYTLGQYSLLWWLPNYYETTLNIDRDRTGAVVGQFWSGMFAAQIFVAWWVYKIGVTRLLVLACIGTTVFSIPLWLYEKSDGLLILAFVWGFANLGLLKITISFATLVVDVPSPRLISALLLGATSGTAVSPWITSRLVESAGNYTVLQFGTLCYLVLTVLILASISLHKISAKSGQTNDGVSG